MSDHHPMCPARDQGIEYLCKCAQLKWQDAQMEGDRIEKAQREG